MESKSTVRMRGGQRRLQQWKGQRRLTASISPNDSGVKKRKGPLMEHA